MGSDGRRGPTPRPLLFSLGPRRDSHTPPLCRSRSTARGAAYRQVRRALLLAALLAPGLAAAQATGSLAGTVVDGDFGGGLPGASVLVVELGTGVATDIDGHYTVRQLPAGTYTVRYSFTGYGTQTVENVEVVAGEPAQINVTLSPGQELQEVVVEADEILAANSEVGLLRVRQRAAQVSDAISAATISQSGSSDAADAMERVTGASVQAGQYVFVRGLGDRYANTQLNGSVLPTADPDRRAVQFDLFPSSFLENIVTLKTFTPDQPGSFSGGLVDINTKSFPDAFSTSFSASSGFSTQALPGSSTLVDPAQGVSPLRFGTGDLAFPAVIAGLPRESEGSVRAGIPRETAARRDAALASTLDAASTALSSRIAPTTGTVPVNASVGFSLGNQVALGRNALGFVLGLTADQGASFYDDGVIGRADFQGVDGPDGQPTGEVAVNTQQLRTDQRATQDTKLGGIANVAYRIGGLTEVSLNTLFSHTTESEARVIDGLNNVIDSEARVYDTVAGYTERTLGSGQLRGRHQIPALNGMEVAWRGSYARTELDEPDLRFFTARVFTDDAGAVTGVAPAGFLAGPRHYFRTLDETLTGGGLDATLPLTLFGRRGELKAGGVVEQTERGYAENLLILRSNTTETGAALGSVDPDAIAAFFGAENTGVVSSEDGDGTPGRFAFGHYALDQTLPQNQYEGAFDVTAAYAMAEVPVLPRLRAIVGARYENSSLFVAAQQEATDDTPADSVVVVNGQRRLGADRTYNDLLPALNLVYSLRDDMNLRAAATRTLARPTFREIAPVVSSEFGSDGALLGNPALERTLITNLDLRWEWFTSPGQLLAVSSYYKALSNPIERVIVDAENNATQYANVDQADIVGAEVEVRQGLAPLAGLLRNLSVGANLSLTQSSITVTGRELASRREIDPAAGDTRPLQGQASYLLNANLSYDNAEQGTSAGLFFNVAGRRLARVGANVDVYEEPSPQLDLIVSQRVLDQFALKLTVKNLLDASYRERYVVPGGGTFPFLEYDRGMSVSVGLAYRPGVGGAAPAAASIPGPGASAKTALVGTD